MSDANRREDQGPQPFRTPPGPGEEARRERDPYIQSPLDMEVFRFLGLAGTTLAPVAWFFGAVGLASPWLALPIGGGLAWLLYLVVRRGLVLTRDMSARAGEGEGVVEHVGRNWRLFGMRGTHLGMVVIDGVEYGVSLKVARSLVPGDRVEVWYYEASRHIIRIQPAPST